MKIKFYKITYKFKQTYTLDIVDPKRECMKNLSIIFIRGILQRLIMENIRRIIWNHLINKYATIKYWKRRQLEIQLMLQELEKDNNLMAQNAP